MDQDRASSMAHTDVLANVKDGMEVYDSAGERIGKVDAIFMGAEADGISVEGGPVTDRSAPAGAADTAGEIFAGIFIDRHDIPAEVLERLRYHGFIRIAPHGLFRSHRYAMRDQVVSAGGDRVTLSVPESKLMKA
jgi:hypothetical protein